MIGANDRQEPGRALHMVDMGGKGGNAGEAGSGGAGMRWPMNWDDPVRRSSAKPFEGGSRRMLGDQTE